MEHCLEAVIAIVGIAKAGGAWVPLDPSYPLARLEYMVRDARLDLVVSQTGHLELTKSLEIPESLVLDLCDMPPDVVGQPLENVLVEGLSPDHLAYVIYTSGTTGRPKGVLVPHRGVVNYIWHLVSELLGRESLKATVLQSSFSFDASVEALFAPLAAGGRVHMVGDFSEVGRLLSADHITCLLLTPSTLEALMANTAIPDSVNTIGVGGEAVSRRMIRRVSRDSKAGRMFNGYGPTEATIVCTVSLLIDRRSKARGTEGRRLVESEQGVVTIGRPLPNMRAYILDRNLQAVPVGVVGELHVGGIGLTRGYLRRPDLTAEKFIANPFSADRGARLYKTGDLARYLPDGRIVCLGRLDQQVKVRGFRIELGEIETVLAAHPGVLQVAVVAHETDRSDFSKGVVDRRLVAYIVLSTEADASVSELRHHLRQELPDYMIPSLFITMDAMPLTPNAKVDRRALPAPNWARQRLREAYEAPRTLVEETLTEIFQEVLGLEQVGVHDDFFDLGGHSLLATRVVSRIRHALQVELPLRCMFEAPTIARLAGAVGDHMEAKVSVVSRIEPFSREAYRMGRRAARAKADE
jgi:amino acid adenylation domain-containing protein